MIKVNKINLNSSVSNLAAIVFWPGANILNQIQEPYRIILLLKFIQRRNNNKIHKQCSSK